MITSLRLRVLTLDSPTRCSAQCACHGSRLRATWGAPSSATRALRSGSMTWHNGFVGSGRARGRPPAACRCWTAAALGARRALRSRKTGEAIPRDEFGLCDPRRFQITTGASVRLACVAQVHPYSSRERAQREYEPRRSSRLAEWAADGQRRRAAFAAAGESAPSRPASSGTRGVTCTGSCRHNPVQRNAVGHGRDH